ncbi:endo-beta-N-acetylglucosaminidase [Oceanobacillus picturae]|uniref:endo-beta-N-acetylglucosaminidase n=1 Tax=Oceanobacillus picturae TaxID=171693 RepID=UPI003645695F
MRSFHRKKAFRKTFVLLVATVLMVQMFATVAFAGDTLPYTGESATGEKQPTQHGYTSHDILKWEPERDKFADMFRSRVPLQERNEPFAATQANPDLPAETQMFNLAGDYGNAFMDSTAYTNKFGQYTFPYWQYVDYYSYWHGMATADVPRDLYDPELPWYERWFEFGVLNVPNPAYTNAAHKNGVKSLGVIFFSVNDRGPQTYTQMVKKDKDGNFPVADKLVEIAEYFGFDGYFFNQEEATGVKPEDIPEYKEFMKALREKGLYVQWYDSTKNDSGRLYYENEFNEANSPFLRDEEYGDVAHSIFLNYNWNRKRMEYSKAHAEELGLDPLESVFAGVEAGADRFGRHRNNLKNNLDENGDPMNSIAMLGADFTHHGLDEDLGGEDTLRRFDNDYQWMSFIRDRAWWSGPNLDPTNPGRDSEASLSDVAAQGGNWDGVAAYIAERSVINGGNFVSHFNLGRGLQYYKNGEISNTEEWSNINIQDVPVTWQWWIDTPGTELQVDYDFGTDYNAGARYDYQQIGAFEGGNSLVINGSMDAENFLRLYKTELDLHEESEFSLTYNKSSNDSSVMHVGVIFEESPNEVEKIVIPHSAEKTEGWVTQTVDLSEYAGKTVAAFGIVFDPQDNEQIDNFQVNLGEVKFTDHTVEKPDAPTGLKITKAFTDTEEMYISWDIAPYEQVKQYNVYNNGVHVGGIYDEVFYIKNMQGLSGTVSVTAVSEDGQESEPVTIPYNYEESIQGIEVTQTETGEMNVSWENPESINEQITVRLTTEYDETENVDEQAVLQNKESEVIFQNTPVNGDKFLIQIQVDEGNWVSYSDTFVDKEIASYPAESVTLDGKNVSWELPTQRDWNYLYVYEDGEPLTFQTTYSQGEKPYIIRGRTHSTELEFQTVSADSKLEFVVQDYAGNTAKTVVRTTLEDLHGDIEQYTKDGVLSNAASKQLTNTLKTAEKHYNKGKWKQAEHHLQKYISKFDGKQLDDLSEDTRNVLKGSGAYLLKKWGRGKQLS